MSTGVRAKRPRAAEPTVRQPAAKVPGAKARPRRARDEAHADPENLRRVSSTEAAAGAARVLRQFRIVFNAVKTHFQQVERQAGIGGAKIWALSVIVDQPGIGVGALARAMDIHQTTASNLVRSLTTSGFVTAHRTSADRRSVQLKALPAGRRLLAASPGPFAGVLPDALEHLPADCLARLEADLDRLIGTLQADPRAAGIPLAEM